MTPTSRIALALIAVLALWAGGCGDPLANIDYVDSEPIQTDFETFPSWPYNGTVLEAVAAFEVEAVVLSARRYRHDNTSHVSPLDLALGWRAMSDSTVLEHLEISQRGRFYLYRWRNHPPVPVEEIAQSSSNMHMIPATRDVWRVLRRAKAGRRVHLQGRLVNVRMENGVWRTSRVRTDTGNGACEILFVESAEVF